MIRPRPLLWVSIVLSLCLAVPGAPLAADKAQEPLARYEKRVDEAIDLALGYLAAKQAPHGGWPSGRSPTGITALCVMAFLAKGYTPGTGPHGMTIDKGIDFVLKRQNAQGVFAPQMYTHCMTTLMLSEVSGMVDPGRQKKIDLALGKALRVILAAQKVSKPAAMQGGWRYAPTSGDSDLSLTGWALMALRSARNGGADIPEAAIERAVGFVSRCRSADGGFSYQPGGAPGLACTGVALLCLELSGKHRDKLTLAAGEWIGEHLPRSAGEAFFYYALYYTAQGMFQLGGDHWVRFATHMYEMMLRFQRNNGSWPAGSSHEAQAGDCYSTAMAVLAFSVTYRQLPIYQR